ncbi:hypothetical protein Q4603_09615 [Zobellia galactanivorans]|uniref:DsrE family protein n=1 Tax=Zobellia galactanivorans (strain DSM 12802 / CCUG 47099 / CIP 106680 / NCIMB 13871 / Dsij) TaxID=63186 RepID=UPI0026E3E45A|nr:DsrE family protein [Zobellia galactanivorans]MDO6808869.1 hypothetical protein [Zobellia galactanivorans]
MKKQFLIIALFALSLTTSVSVNAQVQSVQEIENSTKNDGKYALLVQNSNHFMASVMTGEEYKNKSKAIQFEIVLIGKVVKDLATNKELAPLVEKAQKLGIRIVVCEFAMNKLGVKKSDYPSYVETTSNGFTYFFGLQENGFKTIGL